MIAVLAMLTLSGLAYSEEPSAPARLDQVVLQLKWFHQFQFAGFYAAQEKGFYRAEGLNVTIQERNPKTDVVDDVLSGSAHFGVSDSSLIVSRLKGAPVVLVSPVYQHSPLVLITLADKNLQGPADLAGKRIMYQEDRDDAVIVATMNQMGLTSNDFVSLPHNFDDFALLNTDIDAMAAYVTNQPFLYRARGIPINIIDPANYGIDFYGDGIFTTESFIKSSPETVEAFRRASLKGWKYALEHKAEIVEVILKNYGDRNSREKLLYEAQLTSQMIKPDFIEIGTVNKDRFNRIVDIYKERGRVPLESNLQGFFASEYLVQTSYAGIALKVIAIIGSITTVLAILLMVLNQRLNKLVKMRTRDLEQANQKVQRYVDIINRYTCTYRIDTNLQFVEVSYALCDITGFSSEQLIGKPHTFLFHEQQDKNQIQQMIREVYFGNNWQGEVLQRNAEGDPLTMDVFIEPTYDEQGEPNGYTVVQLDITQNKLIEIQSITDSLTGLYNRAKLEKELSKECMRVGRGGSRFSLLFLDIDHFKQINDSHGHIVGDTVLREIATLIREHLRATDIPGRWGGEEFAIICPNTVLGGAMTLAENLRAATEAHVFSEVKQVTMSIGVTEYVAEEKMTSLFKRADEALYEAKGGGRNKAVSMSVRSG